jgi:ABC-2 type transport system ATP-binding protein
LVAIAHRPELLILDEPSSGLDPIARSDILEAIIRTISEDGRTVLFSSHLLDEVDRVCDSVALMHEGEIIESLKTEQLETRYGEILCRVESNQSEPPAVAGAFGWRPAGQEWSAVFEANVFEEVSLPKEFMIIERRDITLSRWFGARVGNSTAVSEDSSNAGEVIADA